MEIIQTILLVGNLVILFFILKKVNKLQIIPNKTVKQTAIEKIEQDEILTDIVEYTINSGFECMVMPNLEGKNTLFIRNKGNEEILPVVTIPFIDKKRGSVEYDYILNHLKEEVKKLKEKFDVKD